MKDRTFEISGPALKRARKKAGLTQADLGSIINRTASRVHKIERSPIARVFHGQKPKLAAALGMTEAQFIADIALRGPADRTMARTLIVDRMRELPRDETIDILRAIVAAGLVTRADLIKLAQVGKSALVEGAQASTTTIGARETESIQIHEREQKEGVRAPARRERSTVRGRSSLR